MSAVEPESAVTESDELAAEAPADQPAAGVTAAAAAVAPAVVDAAAAMAAAAATASALTQNAPAMSAGVSAPGGLEHSLQVPGSMVGKLIGKQGETIKALQYSTQTRIQVGRAPIPRCCDAHPTVWWSFLHVVLIAPQRKQSQTTMISTPYKSRRALHACSK